jgi:hypothetical protein
VAPLSVCRAHECSTLELAGALDDVLLTQQLAARKVDVIYRRLYGMVTVHTRSIVSGAKELCLEGDVHNLPQG